MLEGPEAISSFQTPRGLSGIEMDVWLQTSWFGRTLRTIWIKIITCELR